VHIRGDQFEFLQQVQIEREQLCLLETDILVTPLKLEHICSHLLGHSEAARRGVANVEPGERVVVDGLDPVCADVVVLAIPDEQLFSLHECDLVREAILLVEQFGLVHYRV